MEKTEKIENKEVNWIFAKVETNKKSTEEIEKYMMKKKRKKKTYALEMDGWKIERERRRMENNKENKLNSDD